MATCFPMAPLTAVTYSRIFFLLAIITFCIWPPPVVSLSERIYETKNQLLCTSNSLLGFWFSFWHL